ncbi:MAG: hypothetical protein ACTHLE_04255 [Agriterribacter sp.]
MIRQADKTLKQQWSDTFSSLNTESKIALKGALLALRDDALSRAKYSWNRHKAPMALYWKVVGVYAGHLAKSIK